MNVSAVIPTYNGADWLPKSIPKVDKALQKAGIKSAEILVVNDGSTDDTIAVVKKIKTKYPLRIVTQKNGGRFLARKFGALEAKYDHTLFVDTRVFIGENSLKYAVEHYDESADKVVWNSHVNVAKEGSIYARFWDAIAYVAWRKYFSNPRDVSYGIKDFDYYPKGTTCFFIPKKILIEANAWFEKNTMDLKTSNDDTLLIRHIAEKHNINLSPHFSCLYHARPNLKQFTKHVLHRGKVFVDGFLRRDGNRFFWPLVFFLFASVAFPVWLLFNLKFFPLVLAAALILWIAELLYTLLVGTPYKDSLSLFVLSPIFAIFYSIGIWVAVIKIYLLNKLTSRRYSGPTVS